MQKWLAVTTLALAVLTSAIGMKNLTVNPKAHTTTTAAAWGSDPLPPTPW